MRPASLIVLAALLVPGTVAWTTTLTTLTRFKMPGPGLYEQSMVTRGPLGREQRETSRLCATVGAPGGLTGLPAELPQVRCTARVLEDTPDRARTRTECDAGLAMDMITERTSPQSFRTTVVSYQSGHESSRTVIDSRRVAATCPAGMANPAPTAAMPNMRNMPKMPAADPATCAQGTAELARLRASAELPAATRDQLVATMQAALRMQGCKL